MRQLAPSIDEHRREGSQLIHHLLECSKGKGGTSEMKSEIIDQTGNTYKFFTLEALHTRRERPKINKRNEFKNWELTAVLLSM